MTTTLDLSSNAVVFMIYSTFGAIFEHLMYGFSSKTKVLANPVLTGFPLYGSGAYLIVSLNYMMNNLNLPKPSTLPGIVLRFLTFGIVLTTVEYAVGVYVGAGKNSKDENGNVHSWDYSNHKFNYKGIITPIHFVIWGILGLVLSHVHPKLLTAVRAGLEKL